MIENHNIICFASSYDAPPTSKHHVMHLLAQRNNVVWVNYHASRTPGASASDLRYMLRKVASTFSKVSRPRENLYVVTPLVVPLPGSVWARRLNRTLLVTRIRSVLRRLPDRPVQVWSFAPDISYLLGRFRESKVVYYCVDDFASFTGYDRCQVLRDEEDLCRRADVVVTTSAALWSSKKGFNPRTLLVPHGVDYAHFSQARRGTLPIPPDMAAIPRPRLGFFGLIRDWVDLELISAVAQRRPQWHFVLIGDAVGGLSGCDSLPNVHLLGRRPYEELPAYCRQMDVGLIPFRINELTRAVNPIKLREYLAAGLPVVSTPLPEANVYRNLIHIAEGAGEFERALESALNVTDSDRASYVEAMARETWPQKLEKICNHLEGNSPAVSGVEAAEPYPSAVGGE